MIDAPILLKSAGGKRKLVTTILKMMPPRFGRYHEPFFGGGALFFSLQPKNAYISDINAKLMNVYRQVQSSVYAVIGNLMELRYNKPTFERLRKRNFNEGTPAQQAAEYIYCNKVGFNGLYRVNKAGQFNVPFGKYENPTICDQETLLAAHNALQGVHISDLSYNRAVNFMQEGDFVFCDPPYHPLSDTSSFTSYTAGGFSGEHQKTLSEVALYLKRRGVFVLISNSSAPLIHQLYGTPDWTIREVQAKRSINSDGEKRGNVTELLIY
jgi:DNA adenine methylase